MGIEICLWRQRVGLFAALQQLRHNKGNLRSSYPESNSSTRRWIFPQRHNWFFFHLFLLSFTWIVILTSLHFCKQVTDVTSVTHCPIFQAHKNWIPATTAVSESMFSPFSFLLLCMDVERNPSPQQQINISDLPVSSKALFNSEECH